MKHLAAAALAALALSCAAPALALQAAPQATSQADSPALAAILADYETYLRGADPVTAALEGDEAARARLPDASRATELDRGRYLQGLATRLAALDPAALSARDRLNHAFLSWLIDRAVTEIGFDGGRLAFNSEGGPGQSAGYLASITRITDRDDAEAWLTRLAGLDKLYADQLANARRGLETGMVQPKSVVRTR